MTASERKTDFTTRDRWLLFAFTIGPIAALGDLLVSNALAPTACDQQSKMMLHISSAVFFIVALIGALIGQGIGSRDRHAADERTRWQSMIVIFLSIASALVIVAIEIPNVILRSCD
jgi:hypothetical protein